MSIKFEIKIQNILQNIIIDQQRARRGLARKEAGRRNVLLEPDIHVPEFTIFVCKILQTFSI